MADSSDCPSPRTVPARDWARPSITLNRWLPTLLSSASTEPMSTPAAAARTSIAGSMGGWNSGSDRTTPAMFMPLRILNRRSSIVSQYDSSRALNGTQK